ncbi:hypothetical protein [Methylobacterium sp. ID0610]|uniref:hypothetical protein n=1 Tax=Methylobacterium carpenticola TaxID=3344827 RepID=UPI0036B0071E
MTNGRRGRPEKPPRRIRGQAGGSALAQNGPPAAEAPDRAPADEAAAMAVAGQQPEAAAVAIEAAPVPVDPEPEPETAPPEAAEAPDPVDATVPAAPPPVPEAPVPVPMARETAAPEAEESKPSIAGPSGLAAMNLRLLTFMQDEMTAAFAHWSALREIRAPGDAAQLQLAEFNRRLAAAMDCWRDLARLALGSRTI